MTIQKKDQWVKVLKETFELFGYHGNVTIEDGESTGEYLIYHDAFEHAFVGFYPKTDEIFTVLVTEHPVKLPDEDFYRTYKEAFVFDAVMMIPLFYSIYQEPTYQRVMITNTKGFVPGEIRCYNSCSRNGYKTLVLDKLMFPSEVFNLEEVIKNLKQFGGNLYSRQKPWCGYPHQGLFFYYQNLTFS